MAGSTQHRRTLSRQQAQTFYDGFGSKQDHQGWYEDAALDKLLALSDLGDCHALLELGCGTGRLAQRMLQDLLPADAEYLGIDLSATMRALATDRVASVGARARIDQAAEGELPTRPGGWDRIVSTYVLDLLSTEECLDLLAQAGPALASDGRLCLAGVTHGTTAASSVVMGGWDLLHRLSPRMVGGCRPIAVGQQLQDLGWTLLHHEVVVAWGVASELVVAQPRASD